MEGELRVLGIQIKADITAMDETSCQDLTLKLIISFDYDKSLVSLATHCQSRLNSFQTVKTLFCIALPGHLDFISFLGCALLLAGDWPQTTIPNERAYNY